MIDVPEGWWVQPNSFGHFVLTDEASQGPGDRDIVMIRPSNLSDPDQPGAPVEEQAGDWPLADIDGWLAALIPGVVDGEPVATTIGGLDAVQFDVSITDEVECGREVCVGFATNRLVNSLWFDRGTGYRVWWIDGGDESPIAIDIGDGGDPEFIERAQAVLDTVTFESVGPNPIPSEGNLWEFGIPSEAPAGTVSLPVGPGVTFEMSESHFIGFRDELIAAVFLDGPGESDIVFPDRAFDGEPLTTVDDVVAALERDENVTATVGGTREVDGYEATEVEVSNSAASGPTRPSPTLRWSDDPDEGWIAPPDGTVWVMETPHGIAAITAEWFEAFAAEPAQALAAEILDSIVIGPDDEDASEDLVGTWLFSRGATWEISDDTISISGGVVDGMEYTATDTLLELTDQPGPSACPPDQPGTYEWQIDDDVLSLTAVSDDCVGRRNALDGGTFERVE